MIRPGKIMSPGTVSLTDGGITGPMLAFALPMIAGNLLQQCYNLADTFIVGRFLGTAALAAVGSSYTLMTFLLSLIIGLCMGSGTLFSIRYGSGDMEGMGRCISSAFVMAGAVTLALTAAVFAAMDPIIRMMNVPEDVYTGMRDYLIVVSCGIPLVFVYNFCAFLLRSVGDSVSPLCFLGLSVALNILLDFVLIAGFGAGISGAAWATVISQAAAAAGILVWTGSRYKWLGTYLRHPEIDRRSLETVSAYSLLTCLQQSVMNFGILMVQGLVNTFGTAVMAAFATAVKIDAFAYMPLQEFGNAFSTFTAQNYGAGKHGRVRRGAAAALLSAVLFSILISSAIFASAPYLMEFFVGAGEPEVIGIGAGYLRIEGAFYVGIGFLFLLYGYFRAVGKPGFSLVLTVISLGIRVALSYILAPRFGFLWIWWSIPIGWLVADAAGFLRYAMTAGKASGRA